MLNNLNQYIKNVRDPLSIFNLALEYERLGQNSSAVSFFLRAANFTNDKTLAYTCLLKISNCIDRLTNRPYSVETVLQQAVAFLPQRPEAYFLLSRFQERRSKHLESYQNSSVGLEVCDFNLDPLPADVGYPGIWGLLFERAVESWHCGKEDQSREIFQILVNDYWYELDQHHRDCVEDNITRLGCGHESKAHTTYNRQQHENLKFKFPESESVHRNFSQVFQDMFVLYMLQGKRNGTFLEVGGAQPYFANNTALLETQFGWSGSSIEWSEDLSKEYRSARPNINVLCRDALTVDYQKLLQENYSSTDIDYLQLDIEPSRNTYEVLLRIPFDQYRFAVITYEHDYYVDVSRSYREKSRKYLKDMGYELVVANICPRENCPFEDWWVHPDLVDRALIEQIKTASDSNTIVKTHFLNSKKKELIVETKSAESPIMMINSSYRKGFWVVDNFYQDPGAVRDLALKQEYHQGGLGRGYIGQRTFQQFLFPGLKEEFERIMGEKITRWEEHDMNGRFQFSMEGEPLVYHCDDQKWAAMIYLTPDAPYETGTGTYALKGTNITHSSHPEIMRCFRPGSQNLDKTIFEPVDVVGNVYNRLVIFNAGYLHAAKGYFGYSRENSRLWQMFFFD
jgi:hypothetical protein